MAKLVISSGVHKNTEYQLFKRITTIGSGSSVDIDLKENPSGIYAYVTQMGDTYTLMLKKPEKESAPRASEIDKEILNHTDVFRCGNVQITFLEPDPTQEAISQNEKNSALNAYKRLLKFSESLASERDIEALLRKLLEEITIVTGAEYGFLVLLEQGRPQIKVRKNTGSEPGDAMSDSIVRKVIETKESVIVNDALHDQEFSSKMSVINFRLSSIMCVPLIYRGNLFGAIYVGNNSFVHVFNQKSLEIMTVFASQASLLVQHAMSINWLTEKTKNLQESLEYTKFGGIIGACSGMQEVFRQVEKVASTDINVLIIGDTGTGKELIARELHKRSLRAEGPFVVINCSAIPENLLESELFGHVRGAFVGATQSRIGKLQSAHMGTLFLDEIADLPPHLQVKLLASLKDQSVIRVGHQKSEFVHIRVITAANMNLLENVSKNHFREDLFYLLNGVQIQVPSLKDRGNDVLVIANYFLQKYAKIYGKVIVGLSEEAQNSLLNYGWPGNVRQLENRMRRAIVMCDTDRICATDLDIAREGTPNIMPLAEALERYKNNYIRDSLERNAGNRTKTALELGVDPRTIFRHLETQKKSGDRYAL